MKRFTPLFTLCFILFPFFYSCTSKYQKEIKGSYEIVKEKIPITDYDEIIFNLPAEVIYEQISQESPFLQVSVDKNIVSFLDISVKNNCLIISQANDTTLKPSQLKIFTNSKNLKKVTIGGVGKLLMKREINAENMEIVMSGAGNIKADSLYCENLKVLLSGTGNIEIKGAATNAHVRINGVGNLNASEYLIQHLDCAINGVGNMDAYVLGSLKALVAGVGNLRYKGNPEIIYAEKNGIGNIIQKKN